MKRLICMLVLLVTLHSIYSVEIVGDFLSVNGIKADGFAVWNRTTGTFIPQYHLHSEFSSAARISIHKSTGDVYYYDNRGVKVWDKTTIMRVGGENGYFFPENTIQNIAVTSRKLYVCGTFQHIGPEHNRINVTTGKGPQIVEYDISNRGNHLHFEQTYSLLPEYPYYSGIDCSSMLIVGDVLLVKDNVPNGAMRYIMENGNWIIMIPENGNVVTLHVAEAQGTLYVNAYNLATIPPSGPYMIQTYSFQSKSWDKVLHDTYDNSSIAQFVVGQNSDEIYLSYRTPTPEDPNRHQKIFLWDGTKVRPIGKSRFYGSLLPSSLPIPTQNTSMHYDTNLKKLVIYSPNLNYTVYGNDEQYSQRPWELYAKKINKVVYYEPINDTFIQAYGGGFDTAPTAIINGENNITYFRGVKVAYDIFAPQIARLNKDTMKFESLFPSYLNGLDYTMFSEGRVVDFALINGGKSAYIGGSFRTIANESRNSIALIHEDGTTEPLGREPHVGVRLWGEIGEVATITPGHVLHIIHLEKEQMIYAAGYFQLAGNATVSNIARYNIQTKTWHDVDGGIDLEAPNGAIYAMIYSHEFNSIFVGGSFVAAGNKQVKNIARWNLKTEQWESLNDGLDGTVLALTMYKGRLLAAGTFSHASGHRVHSRIAVWDGYHWTHLYTYHSQSERNSNICDSGSKCSASGTPKAFVESQGYLYILSGGRVYQYDGSKIKALEVYADVITRDYQGRLLTVSNGELHVYNHKTGNLELINSAAHNGGSDVFRASGATGMYANVVLIAMSMIVLFIMNH